MKLVELSKEKKVINYQNCNNKKMTINVFLNEQCKDAMNLTDFVENVRVSLQDLNYTKKNGYIDGISNIFVKHLQDMKPTERPIHCSDKKRMQFYVKDANVWEKDKSHEKIDKSIPSDKSKDHFIEFLLTKIFFLIPKKVMHLKITFAITTFDFVFISI